MRFIAGFADIHPYFSHQLTQRRVQSRVSPLASTFFLHQFLFLLFQNLLRSSVVSVNYSNVSFCREMEPVARDLVDVLSGGILWR
jgi:hypothetical protein